MPNAFENSFFFQSSSKGHKNKTYSIEVWNDTTIYIGIEKYKNTEIADFVAILNKTGWTKESLTVKTDCCTMDKIWTKKMTTPGLNTISLPVIETDEFLFTVFVTGIIVRDSMKIG